MATRKSKTDKTPLTIIAKSTRGNSTNTPSKKFSGELNPLLMINIKKKRASPVTIEYNNWIAKLLKDVFFMIKKGSTKMSMIRATIVDREAVSIPIKFIIDNTKA